MTRMGFADRSKLSEFRERMVIIMENRVNEADLETLSKIHHEFYYKILHSNYEDLFPKIKGLSPLEMGVLGVLSETPGVMLREIADKLAVAKSTLTSVIDRLEHRGYIYRAISPRDRRSFELILTEDGKEAQREHVASEHGMYGKMIGALDPQEEINTLLTLLRKIAGRF
jgi:DNA-binding MarR family transcriptional regulator